MRILAIDYGERRLGLAISDELQMTARPLKTLARLPKEQALIQIAQIVCENGVGSVVVGLPLRLDGTHGDAAARVEKFIALLGERLSCPVLAWDERLSSYEAEERMRAAGLNTAARRARIDEFAALVILEDYLQHLGT
ncbi:MAG: Holliday junction resolvase RuvX [Acidobacteriota bacterium]